MWCSPAKRTETGDFGQAPARCRSPSTAPRWRAHLSGPRAALSQRADLRSGAAVAVWAAAAEGTLTMLRHGRCDAARTNCAT